MRIDLTTIAGRVAAAIPGDCRVVTGFDGFVDEMISLVGERRALDDFTPVPDIATFGAMISAAAGHSSLREIVINDVHPGGCAVNLADGLASLGVAVDCFATLGEPVHPAYGEIAAKCRGFHSWGREPGRTLAFEFNDGKLMFSAVKQLADFTPDAVKGFLTDGSFAAACAGAQVIALTDWTLYPHMTGVWKMLQGEVFSNLTKRPDFFIDLVDPSSRSAADIVGVAAILRDFEPAGPVTLGLNGNEANILCRLHDLPPASLEATPEETLQQAVALRDRLGISRVLVHRIPFVPFGQLASRIAGELHTGSTLRRLYATDASEYQEMPAGVVFPKTENDLREVIRFANRNGLGLIPRTAGTSLAGQCVGSGLVVDVGSHFTKILSVDRATRRVRVQPGVVRNELNHHRRRRAVLRPGNLHRQPRDDRRHGGQQFLRLELDRLWQHPRPPRRGARLPQRRLRGDIPCAQKATEFEAKCAGPDTLETRIYQHLARAAIRCREPPRRSANFPLAAIPRRNTGYALDLLMDADVFDAASDKPFNLCKLIAGSEGTLFFATEIELDCSPLPPPHAALVCGHFGSINEALAPTCWPCRTPERLRADRPAHPRLHQVNLAQMRNRDFVVGDPGAILVVEIRRDTRAGAEAAVAGVIAAWQEPDSVMPRRCCGTRREQGVGTAPRRTGIDEQRRRRCQTTRGCRGHRRGRARPAGLHRRVRRTDAHEIRHRLASITPMPEAGNCTPALVRPQDAGRFEDVPRRGHGHRLASEKIPGIAQRRARRRTPARRVHPLMVGGHCYGLMREVKALFDPEGIFNPGKIVDTPPMDTSLRHRPVTQRRIM
jgi:FAD/FMN-containing dehydrogenase